MNAFAPIFISPRPEPNFGSGSFNEVGGRFPVRLISPGCVEQDFTPGFEFGGQRRAAPFHRSAGRITIGSTRLRSAVTPFACAKAAPVTLRPSAFQPKASVRARLLSKRYTDKGNKMKERKEQKYLRTFPHLQKWVNQCVVCQRVGIKPETPKEIFPGMAAHYLRKYFDYLKVNQFGNCEQCGLHT